MHGRRTDGWYLTRLELAIGIVLAGVAAAWIPRWFEPMFGGDGVTAALLLIVGIAVLGLVIGLLWMLLIMRGPRETAPAWCYRDR